MNQLSKHQKDISSITAKLIKVLFVLLAILSIASFIKVHSLFSSSPKSKETPSSSVSLQVDQVTELKVTDPVIIQGEDEKLLEESTDQDESDSGSTDSVDFLDVDSSLGYAAVKWLVSDLKKLAPINFDATDDEGWTIMHFICINDPKTEEEKQQAAETLEFLLQSGGDIDALNHEFNYSPLMYAVVFGNFEMCRILLDHSAKADNPLKSGFNWNPLLISIKQKHPEIMKLLIKRGANILAYSKGGTSALQYAVALGCLDDLDYLIETLKAQGITNPENIQVPVLEDRVDDGEEHPPGSSLLHVAIIHNQFEAAEHLIRHHHIDLTLRDCNGELALEKARNFVETFKNDPIEYAESIETAKKILKLFP